MDWLTFALLAGIRVLSIAETHRVSSISHYVTASETPHLGLETEFIVSAGVVDLRIPAGFTCDIVHAPGSSESCWYWNAGAILGLSYKQPKLTFGPLVGMQYERVPWREVWIDPEITVYDSYRPVEQCLSLGSAFDYSLSKRWMMGLRFEYLREVRRRSYYEELTGADTYQSMAVIVSLGTRFRER